MFVLRVYGLSAAQLTGNLNLKEKAHQSPLSAFCARAKNKARQRGGSHTQPVTMPAGACLAPSCTRDVGEVGREEHGLATTEFISLPSPPLR